MARSLQDSLLTSPYAGAVESLAEVLTWDDLGACWRASSSLAEAVEAGGLEVVKCPGCRRELGFLLEAVKSEDLGDVQRNAEDVVGHLVDRHDWDAPQ